MKKIYLAFGLWSLGFAVRAAVPSDFILPAAYENMRPFMNNKMRVSLNPGGTDGAQTGSDVFARTMSASGNTPVAAYIQPKAGAAKSERRVVARSAAATTARSAAPSSAGRRIVARSGRIDSSPNRIDDSGYAKNVANLVSSVATVNENANASQCLADYSECMDGYCKRENTRYNRCYCSAKLAQIDAEYQTKISELTREIAIMRGGGYNIDQEEINEFWNKTFGNTNIDFLLPDIDWADSENRMRGQQAFVDGHNYCSQHLGACFSMASSMQGVYRSSIAVDCSAYETYLNKIKTAAETIVASYAE